MSETPAEWTDADADSLPPIHDITHDAGECRRCKADVRLGEFCERCHEQVARRRARR